MAVEHVVAGPVSISYNSTTLGYTEDGVSITIEPRQLDVFSDDFGGLSAAPADVQLMGGIALIDCLLTKYDHAEVEKLTAYEKAGTAGIFAVLGTLMRQDSEYAALVLTGTSEIHTFDIAFMRQAQNVNKGTRFSKYRLGFECHIDAAATRELFVLSTPP